MNVKLSICIQLGYIYNLISVHKNNVSTSCKSKLKNLPRLHGACFKHENSFAKIMFNKDESVSEMQNKNKLTKLDIWIKLYKL